MTIAKQRSVWLTTGLLWALASGAPVVADDTELFVVDASLFPQARPNVLLVIDTSGSMADKIKTHPTYDPAVDYDGSCGSNTVYWRTSGGNPPQCDTDNWIERSYFKCDAAVQAFATAGYKTDRMGQYNPSSNRKRWEALNDSYNNRYVECEDDHGNHGNGVDADNLYARDGNTTALWSNSPGVNWGSNRLDTSYTVYEGNFLNWYHGDRRDEIEKIEVVKDVATNLLDTVDGINVGLMRFNWNIPNNYVGGGYQHGGAVIHEMENISTAREDLKDAINDLDAYGSTPLSETLIEAYRYYRGASVKYGNITAPQRSVNASRTPSGSDVYKTPVEFACQKNFIVYLTDGEPQFDDHADDDIEDLYGSCNGNCMDEMAAYLYEEDLSPVTHDGLQNVITHTIGFDIDLPLLDDTAEKGGGKYFQANNTAELTLALSNIVADILDTQTTFTSPTVSVNSFNRTQNLNDLYVTMFEPAQDVHWAGNLKKYRLNAADSTIVDVNGNPAVDGDFFAETSQSYWSASADGASVTKGGAASRIPSPANRDVYTCLGCTTGRTSLTADANAVSRANTALDSTVLDLDADADPVRDTLIDFIRGMDVTNVDGDSNTTVRNQMGDPLHSQPATVMYSQDTSVVYFATNDGYLHAIDTESGAELWSFIPEEFLTDMVDLYHNTTVAEKHYGIDGSLRVHIVADNDGAINGTDKVYLYFGMRRGGDMYYALDVTDPEAPAFLWKKSSSDMPAGLDLGQSWSNPIPTRVDIQSGAYNGSNTTEKLVLIFGAGYDAGHDQPDLPVTPDEGNGIVIVDALDGSVLWHVTRGGGDMSASMASMNYSFAGDIKVVDLDGDKYADRMYAADMGGQVWRFDIANGSTRSALVTGGVIARLGGAPAASPAREDARRFYYAPDVALVSSDVHNFMHIGVGSGHRAGPNSLLTHDRFYALRDHNPFKSLTQAEFNAREADPIIESDLEEIRDRLDATVPAGSAGWMMELRAVRADDGDPKVWSGEKVLAEARTFDNKVYFTSFTPGASATANDCSPRLGTNRLYIVDLFTGAPTNNLDGNGDETDLEYTDRYMEFGGSIASEAVFLFPSPEDPEACVGEECTPPPVVCVDLFCLPVGGNDPVRTFWSQESIDQ